MATDIIARGMITEYKSGTNISFKENDDGSVTISASGDVSSEDTVARETIDNHKLDKNNPHNVTPAQIGLGNVDNTADLDKPISTAVQTALDGKVDKIDVKDNLESTDTTSPLSANQGKVLNKKITEHTDNSDIHVTTTDKENWNSHPTDITASGNPVQLDGLQGGVPFNEISVSGKNLITYPYYSTTLTDNGVTFTDNGDGTITANGTVPTGKIAYFSIDRLANKLIPGATYTLTGCPEDGGNSNYSLYISERTDDDKSNGKYYLDYGNGITFEMGNYEKYNINIQIRSGVTVDNVVFRPQLELGDTATDYEPPIMGMELQVNVCGKNLIAIPNWVESQNRNGVDVTVSDYVTTANGTLTAACPIPSSILIHNCIYKPNVGDIYVLSIFILDGSISNIANNTSIAYLTTFDNPEYGTMLTNKHKVPIDDLTSMTAGFCRSLEIEITADMICPDGNIYYNINHYGRAGNVYNNVKMAYMLTKKYAPTEYEPYHGSTTTITPTSNPYIIPNDISQQEGYNVISVSDGEISVTGVRKNAAIKKIWDNMGMDLLFDGITDESNPAMFDLTGYNVIEIHHIMVSTEKVCPIVIRMSIDNYLATSSTIIIPICESSVSTVHNENGKISSLYAVSADGSAITNTKIYGIR